MKKNMTAFFFHLFVILISAGTAFFLPFIIQFVSRKVLQYWALIENEELFLISTEIASAIALIIFINVIVRDLRIRKSSFPAALGE